MCLISHKFSYISRHQQSRQLRYSVILIFDVLSSKQLYELYASRGKCICQRFLKLIDLLLLHYEVAD